MKLPRVTRFLASALVLIATSPLWAAMPASDSQDVRTNEQMEELVAKASTAADHELLRKHFLDMASSYESEARIHSVMAGSDSRTRGAHDLLARQARKAAATATELAELHARMATEVGTSPQEGTHQALPMAEPRYPDLLSAEQARELVASAKTPADHAKLSKHFAAEAARLTDDSRRHAAMATGYRTGDQRGSLAAAADHCARLVRETKDAAKAASQLSKHHAALASNGGEH